MNRNGPPLGSPDQSRTFPRVQQIVPDLLEVPLLVPGLPEDPPTHPEPHGGFPDPFRTSGRVPQPI